MDNYLFEVSTTAMSSESLLLELLSLGLLSFVRSRAAAIEEFLVPRRRLQYPMPEPKINFSHCPVTLYCGGRPN